MSLSLFSNSSKLISDKFIDDEVFINFYDESLYFGILEEFIYYICLS